MTFLLCDPAGTSNELDVQNKSEETHTQTLHTKRERKWYQKNSEKATSSNKHKEKKKKKEKEKEKEKHVWLSECLHIEGRLNEGPRLQRVIKTNSKQNKTNVTPKKDAMAYANQTPGGYKFAPLVANHQGRANQPEPACFGLSFPWSFPSRSGIQYAPPLKNLLFCARLAAYWLP